MLGGIKTAEAAGLKVPNRGEIYERISALPEGQLFRLEEIVGDDDHLAVDFAALRGHDYIHLADGWFVGIVETETLRRLPKVDAVMAAYARVKGSVLVETGDRIAWRIGLKQWEPILGIRYYTDADDDYIAYTRFGTRVINAPDWLRAEDETSRLLRAFHDTPAKEMAETLKRVRSHTQLALADIEAVAKHARAIGALTDEERERWDWLRCPLEIAALLEDWIVVQRNGQEAA